jgi:predicted membrane protein (TIGR00267 family)
VRPNHRARESARRFVPPQEEGSLLFAERERIERLSRVRELVFGSLDGLIVPLGVVSGVAGGVGDSRVVVVAGIAEAFAGALSMQIYEHDGVSSEDAKAIVSTLTRYPRAYQKDMVFKELGINTLEPETVKTSAAVTIGLSYLVGSIFPLISYFFLPVPMAFPLSLLLTFVALVTIGVIKGKLASMNLGRSIVEIVIVGVVSAGGGYLLGTLIPQLLGY